MMIMSFGLWICVFVMRMIVEYATLFMVVWVVWSLFFDFLLS